MGAESNRDKDGKRVVWPTPKPVREDREWYDGLASGKPSGKVVPRGRAAPFRKSAPEQRALEKLVRFLRDYPDPAQREMFETALRSVDAEQLYRAVAAYALERVAKLPTPPPDPERVARIARQREVAARRYEQGWTGPEADTSGFEGLI